MLCTSRVPDVVTDITLLTGSIPHCTRMTWLLPVWHRGYLKFLYLHSSLHNCPFPPLISYIIIYRCIRGLGHSRDSDPTHRALMAETSGSSGPWYCFLWGFPPKGYGSRSAVETTNVDTGHIFEDPDQDAYLLHPTKQPWQGPFPHGVSDINPPAATLPGIILWDLQHPQRTGIQDCSGNPGGMDWRFWPNDSDGDQYHWPGLFPK